MTKYQILTDIKNHQNDNEYFLVEYLKNTGNLNANGNYSGGVTGFTYTNTSGNTMKVKKITLYLEDSGSTFTNGNFGQLGAITNGLKFYYNDGSKILLHNDLPLKKNTDILQIFKEIKLDQLMTGNLLAVWKPSVPILLKDTWKFGCDLNDDMTGIDNLNFQIELVETQ